jgi:hypothetical protein
VSSILINGSEIFEVLQLRGRASRCIGKVVSSILINGSEIFEVLQLRGRASRCIGKVVSSILINGSAVFEVELVNRVGIVQECDATGDAQSDEDGFIKILLQKI